MELLLTIYAFAPRAWVFRAGSIVATSIHWRGEVSRAPGAPFYEYSHRCFGWGIRSFIGWPFSDLVGRLVFLGLALILYALAWFGYRPDPVLVAGLVIFPEFFLGVLLGARAGDTLLSHIGLRLWFRDKGPNPGLRSVPLYAVEVAVAPCFFPVSRAGFAVGFGAFAAFWSLSFLVMELRLWLNPPRPTRND